MRFSVEQIVATLKQVELGLPIVKAVRQLDVSEQAIYRRKKQYDESRPDQDLGERTPSDFAVRSRHLPTAGTIEGAGI